MKSLNMFPGLGSRGISERHSSAQNYHIVVSAVKTIQCEGEQVN